MSFIITQVKPALHPPSGSAGDSVALIGAVRIAAGSYVPRYGEETGSSIGGYLHVSVIPVLFDKVPAPHLQAISGLDVDAGDRRCPVVQVISLSRIEAVRGRMAPGGGNRKSVQVPVSGSALHIKSDPLKPRHLHQLKDDGRIQGVMVRPRDGIIEGDRVYRRQHR